MPGDVTIGMMTEEFLVWRCLHGGPLDAQSIEQWQANKDIPWPEFRARNLPLLRRLTQVYGACAVLARDGDRFSGRVVGTLRFYPKSICTFSEHGGAGMCLQQAHPAGPVADMADADFQPLEQLPDKTLFVHCLMLTKDCQRKGVGTRMARYLIEWAGERKWQAIEATAYEDLDIIYAVAGVAGKNFWEKLGFSVAAVGTEPGFEHYPDILKVLREQGRARGIPEQDVTRKYTMRLGLR